jgi:hypothetical protein
MHEPTMMVVSSSQHGQQPVGQEACWLGNELHARVLIGLRDVSIGNG